MAWETTAGIENKSTSFESDGGHELEQVCLKKASIVMDTEDVTALELSHYDHHRSHFPGHSNANRSTR